MLKNRMILAVTQHKLWGSVTLAQYVRRLQHPAWLGISRRTTPVSSVYGWNRGLPVDRYYIECFLEGHRLDIHGYVLEVKDTHYIDKFGAEVRQCEVLDIDPSNPRATIIADLAAANVIPSDTFDCFVCTQTLQYIYNIRTALAHAYRTLRPGGVLLATVPCLCRVDTKEVAPLSDYWRLTVSSCRKLFGEVFGIDHISVSSHGNVLAAIAFLSGITFQELHRLDLDKEDENFPLIIAVRAIKV